MGNHSIRYTTFLVDSAITKYITLIKNYAERVSTWKNSSTCEKYYREMNICEDFIDAAIIFLAENNMPLKPRKIAIYNKYQEMRAEVVC